MSSNLSEEYASSVLHMEEDAIVTLMSTIDQYEDDMYVTRWLPVRYGKVMSIQVGKVLPCNFRFFFKGKIMLGPGKPLWIYVLVLFISISASFIGYDVLPYSKSWPDLVPATILLLFMVSAIYNLLRSVMMDPGYVLPHWCKTILKSVTNQLSETSELTLEEIRDKYGVQKYCRTCKIFADHKTVHCSKCHACIDNFDHHCPIFGTCVGRRNFGNFYLFILSANVSLLICVVASFIHLCQDWNSHGASYALRNAVTLYILVSTIVVPPLGIYSLVAIFISHTKKLYLEEEESDGSEMCCTEQKIVLRKEKQTVRFLRTLYDKVVKSPPPSQIPFSRLQHTVALPTVLRTKTANVVHNSWQEIPTRTSSFLLPSRNQNNKYTVWCQLESIRRKDTEAYAKLSVPLVKLQSVGSNIEQDIEEAFQNQNCNHSDIPEVKLPTKREATRSLKFSPSLFTKQDRSGNDGQ